MKEEKRPFLSVITINRNNAEGLKRTIESVVEIAKDFENTEIEYIIIDGNSTDDSKQIIENFSKSPAGKKVIRYWISEPDEGIFNAINKGLKKANGQLINIMNSGDTFIPHSLKGLKEIYEQNPNAILYGGVEITKNNKFSGSIYAPMHTQIKEVMMCHQAIFTPKIFHEKYGFYDESFKARADYDFFLKLYTNNEKFIYIHKLVALYDGNGFSQTSGLMPVETNIIKKKYNYISYSDNRIFITVKKMLKYICPFGLIILYSKLKSLIKK
ncbi:MAG: glycosyltransferase family 2 protein [Spirochaetia bacterium]|nr:glycosyltransferase family 2 protein [Spirochaetia bacterium]